MNKRDAIRLKPGTELLCSDHADDQYATHWWIAEVIRTTKNGGILVLVIEGRSLTYNWCGSGTGPNVGEEMWFPYHRVWKRGPR